MYRYSILVVEDDPLAGRVLSRFLRNALGADIICAAVSDPKSAGDLGIEYLHAHYPDVVVVDGLDSHCRNVISAANLLDIPAIVYSGDPDKYQGLGVLVCAKPNHTSLLEAIRSTLEILETLS